VLWVRGWQAKDGGVIDVVCALIEDPQRGLLACKRAAGTHLAGCWEFPGGKVEAGESPEAALIREIREELDVDIEVGPPLTPVEWTDGKVSIRLLPFRSRIVSGMPMAHEHEEIRWCERHQLTDIEWAPADLPILAEWSELVVMPE